MPRLPSRKIAVLVDVAGCPNRCRHCWLGNPPNRRVHVDTIRWIARQFREWRRPGDDEPFAQPLTVMTWYREPDFAPDYRALWDLERELSDEGHAQRFELLSIWRLAHDETYAPWAREIGTMVCQITFFGMEESTDYFVRRPGAFRDSLVATERLLNAGIVPRWQPFLTRRALPELEAFVALIHSLDLDRRVRALGHDFTVFARLPGPSGEAFEIEHLRPTVEALHAIPPYLALKTLKHFGQSSLTEVFGRAEQNLLPELLACDKPEGGWPDTLAFMVTPGLDVYSNVEEPAPWWRLGNLQTDGIAEVMRRFEHDEVPGLRIYFGTPVSELARRYGRPRSRRAYTRGDLIERWQHMEGVRQAYAS